MWIQALEMTHWAPASARGRTVPVCVAIELATTSAEARFIVEAGSLDLV